jgi:hypothetical protein
MGEPAEVKGEVIKPGEPRDGGQGGAMVAFTPQVTDYALAPVEQQKVVLEEYDQRRKHFIKWLMDHLVEGVHYGVPPGCEPKGTLPSKKQWRAKPTLYKAGAMLLGELLQLRPRWAPDRETWEMLGAPKGTACYLCELTAPSGQVVGRGRGVMQEGEKKIARIANSRVKLAQKRAHVDAIISCVPGLSDLFTQDLDDGAEELIADNIAKERARAARERAKARGERGRPASQDPATEPQRERLWELASEPGLTEVQVRKLTDAAKDPHLTSGKAGVLRTKAEAAIAEAEANPPEPPPAEREPGED